MELPYIGGVTEAEKALCLTNLPACIVSFAAAVDAHLRTRHLEGRQGGMADALRHTYWSARMAAANGLEWAAAFADAHEQGQGGAYGAMDDHNNAAGRLIGSAAPDAEALWRLTLDAFERRHLRVLRNGRPVASGSR